MRATQEVRKRLVHAATPGRRPLAPEDLWRVARLGTPVASPTGDTVAYPVTRADVDENRAWSRIHITSKDQSNGRPLTSPDRHAIHPAFSSDGKTLAFCARPAKDPKAPMQVYTMPLDGGEARCHTDVPLGAFDPKWTPDGKGLVFGVWLFDGHLTLQTTQAEQERRKDEPVTVHATEARMFRFWDTWLTNGRIPHLFHLDVASGALTDVMPSSTYWFGWMDPTGAYDVAPDGSELVFVGLHIGGPQNRLRSDVFRLPLDGSGTWTCLTEANPAANLRPRYAPDGTWILYGRTEDPDFYADRVRLVRIDRDRGDHTPLLEDWDRSPAQWQFLPDGTVRFTAEDDGGSRLFTWTPDPATTGTAPTRLGKPVGTCGAPAAARDGRLFYVWESSSHPPELFTCDPDGANARAVSAHNARALDGVALGEVHDIRFKGAGGDDVQMFVVRPPCHDTSRPAPLVHMIHGGPHGMFGDFWHARWNAQAFAAPGYVTALVNFHGSTSWGQTFAQCIQGAWGDAPATDIHEATDVLVDMGWADPKRIGISGGSYGGYLVSWLASTSERFACAINHAGVYDLTLQYASDVTWGRPRNMGAQIWEDPDQVDRWNPARHSAGLNTPMLVIHGEKDYRVPINHALICYGILQARGVPSRLLYYEDENHWILKPKNSIRWSHEVNDWFARFLKESAS